jgi:glycosyltransferase family protein
MKKHLYYIYWFYRTLPYRWNFPKLKIMTFEETIDDIKKNQKSISRFGDGEFRLLIKNRGIAFQNLDNEIAEKLVEVLNSKIDNLIIAIPSSFTRLQNLKQEVKIHWLNVINLYGSQIALKIIDKSSLFGDSLISRFYFSYVKKNKIPRRVSLLRQIWDKRDLLIIEGEFSRLGVANDFFSNAKTIERILCPSKNAFDKYNEILQAAKKYGRNKLIIIALGPTATILAYDLAKEGFWALDLGHIDIEYCWFLMNSTSKVLVNGKRSAEISLNENLVLSAGVEDAYFKTVIMKII